MIKNKILALSNGPRVRFNISFFRRLVWWISVYSQMHSLSADRNNTTARTPITTTEKVYEGSGDITCQDLYDFWKDEDFPGGLPPPLTPNEELLEELCDFLRNKTYEQCLSYVRKRVNLPQLCLVLLDTDDENAIDRIRRHKHVGNNLKDLSIQDDPQNKEFDLEKESSDLLFDEVDNPSVISKYKVEIDSVAKPKAVSWSTSTGSSFSSVTNFVVVAVSLTYTVIVVF